MFFLKGNRNMLIRTYRIHDRQCNECNNFDLTVKIYKDYFHFWFIPIIPSGVKSTKIQCNACGAPMRSDSLAKEYEAKTRVPFYLYGGVILAVVFVLSIIVSVEWTDYHSKKYITQPKVGDVYEIKVDKPIAGWFSFAMVVRVDKDSVILLENSKMYPQQGSTFDGEDHFQAESAMMSSKAELENMYAKHIIVGVNRGYDTTTGFNRIK